MKTFIEQKQEVKDQIRDLERRNCQLLDEMDKNDEEISRLLKLLPQIGKMVAEIP
jgi:hypothetical protein